MINVIIDQIGPSNKKKANKMESFVIFNNDSYGGIHINSIIGTLKKAGLKEQDARFRSKSISNIKLNDCIIVGDCDSTFNFDYRVLKYKHHKQLDELDGRVFKVYDAIREYDKVLAKIEKYAKANGLGKYASRNNFCSRFMRTKQQQPACPATVEYSIQEYAFNVKSKCPKQAPKCPFLTPTCPVLAAKYKTSYKRVDPIRTTEKCTIFDNWVKVGMHQFDIESDCLGNQFITDKGRNKYYISEDRFGRRFLVTR